MFATKVPQLISSIFIDLFIHSVCFYPCAECDLRIIKW